LDTLEQAPIERPIKNIGALIGNMTDTFNAKKQQDNNLRVKTNLQLNVNAKHATQRNAKQIKQATIRRYPEY